MKSFSIYLLSIIIVAFGVVGYGVCGEDDTNLNKLIGYWKPDIPNPGYILIFRSDGTYAVAYSIEKLDTRPMFIGDVKIEGDRVTFISSNSPNCKTMVGNYTIKINENDNFQLTVNEDPCDGRQWIFLSDWNRVKE